MPIFGNNVAPVGSLGIATDDLFGHFDSTTHPAQGNPVPGGDLVSCHVYMSGPPGGQPDANVQLAVYDATLIIAPNYTVVAISTPFVIVNGTPAQWWSTPIAGALTPGSTYATSVLSVHAGGNPSVWRGNNFGGSMKYFIVPGVFPDPLGIVVSGLEWLLYTTYTLPDRMGEIAPVLSAACCEC